MAENTKKNEKLSLPASGYDTLTKILHAYALCKDQEVTLDTIAQKSGIGRTAVSPNHPFLTALGILEGGKKKRVAEAGKNLVVAISNELDTEVAASWQKVLETNPQTKSVLDMIRIQKKVIPTDELRKRIASTLGLAQSKQTTTGVNCLIEIFQRSGLLIESDGGYLFNEGTRDDSASDPTPPDAKPDSQAAGKNRAGGTPPLPPGGLAQSPSVHIDIQIHISADAKADQIDHIFASMAKHLYGKER